MSLRIESAKLAGMLTDLAATASKADDALPTSAVLLHSTRGDDPRDIGKADLLVGSSSNRFAMGQAHTRAEGQLPGPMLWPIIEVHNLIDVLKRKTRGEKDEGGTKHAVRITKSGVLVEITEDPVQRKLFGEKLWSTKFPVGDLNDYPRGLWDLFRAGDRAAPPVFDDGREVHPLPRVDFDPAYLGPFLGISKRRGWLIEAFVRHHRLPVHVQIGPEYRGAVVPAHYSDTDRNAGISPSAPIFDPGLPPRVDPTPTDAKRVDLDATDDNEDGAE